MKSRVKFREEDRDASSPFCHLPDELILQIINKLTDLKTLCFCYLVSRRFSTNVVQVEAISLSHPLINPRILVRNTVGPSISFFKESFIYSLKFLSKFKGVKSLRIELPSSSQTSTDNPYLFNWMVNFGNRIESFVFLSPDWISDINEPSLVENGDNELLSVTLTQKSEIACLCMEEVMVWHRMLLLTVKHLPTLEKVSITDTGRRGRLSFSGEKLNQVKEWLHSASEIVMQNRSNIFRFGYIPVLKLPVSRYMMKGVYICAVEVEDIQGGNDSLINSDSGFEDAAYNEAVKEILEKHMDMMHRFHRNLE